MKKIIIFLLAMPLFGFAQNYQFVKLTAEKNTSMRGLSILNDSLAWVSGSKGYVGKTINGGKNWTWTQVAGFEKNEFRDIQAFDDQHALILGIGSPGYILRTTDGGKSWKEVYKNTDSLIFLDGMDFWNDKQGIAFGDPINNKMQLLYTNNNGETWNDISANLKTEMAVGEAAFAASGTSITTGKKGKVWIVTGGTQAKVYTSNDFGENWEVYDLPILQGKGSEGAYSVDFYDNNIGLVVGGDYTKDKESKNNVLLTKNGGKTWYKPKQPVAGFRSGVVYINKKLCFATGTSGTDVSTDGGTTWKNISTLAFNPVGKAKSGKLVLLTGNKGEIYQLVVNK